MSGISELGALLRGLHPVARPGEYVFVAVPHSEAAALPALATVREDEATTVVLERADADAAGLAYDFVAAWITLTVHSDLAAVGLTAAFSAALAERGIGCNVLAGYRHDHLLVPLDRGDDALAALRALAGAG